MLQKKDRQWFYTKKVMMLYVFLFFSLGSQADGQGIAGDGNQIIGSAKREAIDNLEVGQLLNERRLVTPQTLLILTQNDRKEATEEEINQFFRGFCFGYEQQIFWINENGTAEITSPLLQQNWVVEEGSGQETNKIERKIQNNETCPICLKEFKEMKSTKIFVYNCNQNDDPHMFCYDSCYIQWRQRSQEEKCLVCRRRPVPVISEEISQEDKIRRLKNTRNINYVERNQQEPFNWKLYPRSKDYDETIGYETRIHLDNLIIVGGVLSDMEVLEINLNNLKDLKEDHIKIIQGLKFLKVKFNGDQEPRGFYLVFQNTTQLQILHNGSVLFDESADPARCYSIEKRIKNRDTERNSLGRVICHYIYTRTVDQYNHIFVFNKKRIEYLKETKEFVVFDKNLENVSIGLEGDEIIPQEDINDLFIGKNEVGLACDNIHNFKEAKNFCLLSPVDLQMIEQINKMKKDSHKLPIPNNSLGLIDENCFLLPLFKLISKERLIISLKMKYGMAERRIGPRKKSLNGLKEIFAGVKIEGEELVFNLKDYAIVVLLYFDENALNVFKIVLIIPATELKCNDIWNELTGEGGPVLKNQTLTPQNAKRLDLIGEGLDFAVNAKIMENINFKELTLNSQTIYINESFVCKNENDQSIMKNELVTLTLYDNAIKYLLYFKGINKIDSLYMNVSCLEEKGYSCVPGVLERVRTNNIKFLLPAENCLQVFALNREETITKLRKEIVHFDGELTVLD